MLLHAGCAGMKSIVRLGLWIMVALLLLPVLTAGAQGDAASQSPSLSADGRYVAFYSYATNLVSGDTNAKPDIFVRDRQTGTTTLVSKNSAGAVGNDVSFSPFLSADGRYVAFYSIATNLASGDTNGFADVFVRDRNTGTTYMVSRNSAGVQGDEASYDPSLSPDGRNVTFHSFATNLVSGDTSGKWDVFFRDRQAGVTYRVSKSSAGAEGNDASTNPSFSADGRYVAFDSYATNLVAGDANAVSDIFVRDRQAGTTTLVSKSSAGGAGDGDSSSPLISADGRYVAFESAATTLVSGDTNGKIDIFVRDRQTGTTTLVSKSSAGVGGDGDSYHPSFSVDGRYVVFTSAATNLVSGDTNGAYDVFVRDRNTGTTTLVSRNSAGTEGDGDSSDPSISADGRYIAFESDATNLLAGDTNGAYDVFVRDRQTGTTTLVSKS
jgi:Tol biopolymer transport system component